MPKIECKDFEYFLAVAKHGNISKASEELYISQPALTKYIKNLEERLETQLFYRDKRPMVLTPAGEMYMSYAKEIVTLKNTLENELRNERQKNIEPLRVGYACTGLRNHLFEAVNILRREEINSSIIMEEMTSTNIENKLAEGELEIGFVTLPPRNDRVGSQLLMEEDLLLAVPASHPLASLGTPCYSKHFPTINLDRFSADKFALRAEGTRFRESSNALFEQAGFKPNVVVSGRNNFSCLEFAEAWKICCITTESFIYSLKDADSMRFFIAGPKPQKLYLGFAYRKGSMLSYSATQLINALSSRLQSKE